MASFTNLKLEDSFLSFNIENIRYKAKSYADIPKVLTSIGLGSEADLRKFRIAFKAYLRENFPELQTITSFTNEPNRWLRINEANIHPTDSFQAIKSFILNAIGGIEMAATGKLVESVKWSPQGNLEVKFKGLVPITFRTLMELNRYIAENFTSGAAMTICEQGAQQFSDLLANTYSDVSHVTGMGDVVLKDGTTKAMRPDTTFTELLDHFDHIVNARNAAASMKKEQHLPNGFSFQNKKKVNEAPSMAQQEMDLAGLIQSLLGVPPVEKTAPPVAASAPETPEVVATEPTNPLVAALNALGMSDKEVKKLLKKKEDKDRAERRNAELKNLTEREKELKTASLELRKEKKALAQPLMTKQQMGVMGVVMFLIAFVTQMGASMMRNKNKNKAQEVEEEYYHESRRQHAMPAEGQTCSPQNRPRTATREKPRVKVAQKVKEAVRVSH